MTDTYQRFLNRMQEIHDLTGAAAILSWDQETYLPPKGVPSRARHQAALAGIVHDRLCDPELGRLIAVLAAPLPSGLPPEGAASVREARRQRDRAVKIPKTLVTELAETVSLAQPAWVDARERNDFASFAPHLEKLVGLKQREAAAVGHEGEPYNALLDEYEPGARVEALAELFGRLRDFLVPLLEEIREASGRPNDALLRQEFDLAGQERLSRHVLEAIGFDFTAGRLDVSAHPFTSDAGPRDVRLTTHYNPQDLRVGLYASIHEGGHGLYEQGLPVDHEGAPFCEAVSLGIHESQSRLWENLVGRGRPFLTYLQPRLRELFPSQLGAVGAEELYRAVNVVAPSLIRIEADEVTYNLHIILRLELERALLRGDIVVRDLPRLWNEKVQAYLGLTPPNDARGVLQDIHWAFGLFGYFPTYTLGNLYAAQFFARASAELPDLAAEIARGSFAPLLGWLRARIHVRGRLLGAGELCREVTGAPLSIDPFARYLRTKYGELYAL